MEKLKNWLDEQIQQKRVEPNSSLGKAIAYMRSHWTALTLFLKVVGAPIDNNVAERRGSPPKELPVLSDRVRRQDRRHLHELDSDVSAKRHQPVGLPHGTPAKSPSGQGKAGGRGALALQGYADRAVEAGIGDRSTGEPRTNHRPGKGGLHTSTRNYGKHTKKYKDARARIDRIIAYGP